MSHKTSAARREAFFRALAETGNQTVAAERARVSRSWVTLHRANNPEFRARMEAALVEARERLRASDVTSKPPSGWGSLDGEELVVRGTNGRRTQIARARLKQWTPRAEARFLGVLAQTCNVKAACAEVGMSQPAAYNHYRRWPGFAERWDEALEEGYVRLEAALIQHGLNLFSDDGGEAPDDLPVPEMSEAGLFQQLNLHQNRMYGVGRRPGRVPRPPDYHVLRASVKRELEAVAAAREYDRRRRKGSDDRGS